MARVKDSIDNYKDRMTCSFGLTLTDPKTKKPLKKTSGKKTVKRTKK